MSPGKRPITDNMAYTDDPWAVSDNEEDVAMVGGTLDIVDELKDEHVRTVPSQHSSPGHWAKAGQCSTSSGARLSTIR